MLSACLIVGIHRIGQEYPVQNLNALYITGPDAKHGKGLAAKLLGIDGNLLSLFITGIQCLTLRKEKILWRFHCIQRIQRRLFLVCLDSVVYLTMFVKRHIKIHVFCDGGKE